MTEDQLDQIKKVLPKNFRIICVFADLEGPAEVVGNFPDYHKIQVLFQKSRFAEIWKDVAYVQQFWPNDPEDVIYLLEKEYYPHIEGILSDLRLQEQISIVFK